MRRLRSLDFALALVAGLAASGAPGPARADDARCITALNQNAAGVVKALGRNVTACVKAADEAGLPEADACAESDPKNRITKAWAKLVAQDVGGDQDRCDGTPPGFLYEGSEAANAAARRAAFNLAHEILGESLDDGLVSDGDRAQARCRHTAIRSAHAVLDAQLAVWNACKKAALKAGAASTAEVESTCFAAAETDFVDAKGKIAKAYGKLTTGVVKTCVDPALDTDALLPGRCVGTAGDEFGPSLCIVRRAKCHACNAVVGMDGVGVDCDLFDDEQANASCFSCGDGTVEPGEECDGGADGAPLCSATCQTTAQSALVYSNPCNGGTTLADEALAALGVAANTFVSDPVGFHTAFDAGGFDVVVYDGFCNGIENGVRTRLESWIAGGGRTLVAYWDLSDSASLQAALGVATLAYGNGAFRAVHADPASPANPFDLRRDFPTPLNGASSAIAFTMGQELTLAGDGVLLARLDSDAGPGAIASTSGGRVVTLGFTPEMVGANNDGAAVDGDTDGVPDMQEMWENLIALVLSN